MNLHANDFAIFGLPERFSQNTADIAERWKALQRQAHPDKFAADGAAAQRLAAQTSARINEAYARLRDPLKRAAYLCELRGAKIDAEKNTAMPPAFLVQQMEWRESLDEAQTERNLEEIDSLSISFQHSLLSQIEQELDKKNNPAQAAQLVRQALFVQKFRQDLEKKFEQMA